MEVPSLEEAKLYKKLHEEGKLEEYKKLIEAGKPLKDHGDKGVGDTVARVLRKAGIRPCGGCQKRKDWLNKHFPYPTKAKSDTPTPDKPQ